MMMACVIGGGGGSSSGGGSGGRTAACRIGCAVHGGARDVMTHYAGSVMR